MAPGSTIWMSVSRTHRKSSPLLLEKAPGTFSQTANFGYSPLVALLISRMMRAASWKRPLRVVFSSPTFSFLIPARFPAMLMSWHGLPNVTTSTRSMSCPWIRLTSPRWIISGKRLRVTAIWYGSTSLAYFGVIPHKAPASGKPPDPSNKLSNLLNSLNRPIFGRIHSHPPRRPSQICTAFYIFP